MHPEVPRFIINSIARVQGMNVLLKLDVAAAYAPAAEVWARTLDTQPWPSGSMGSCMWQRAPSTAPTGILSAIGFEFQYWGPLATCRNIQHSCPGPRTVSSARLTSSG